MKQLKLIDVISKDQSNNLYGFFNALVNETYGGTISKWYEVFSWSKDIVNGLRSSTSSVYQDINFIDDDYVYNHASELLIAPLLKQNLGTSEKMDSTTKWVKILQTAYVKYYPKWERLWNVVNAEYNPIENYNMVEQETMPTKTIADDFKEETHNEVNTDLTTNESVYGFNSDNPVPVSRTNTNGSKVNNYSDQTKSGTSLYNTRTESYDTYRELTRSGNIGVTTSQQMLESEIALWKWNFIQDVIYKDLDDLLTLNIYGGE